MTLRKTKEVFQAFKNKVNLKLMAAPAAGAVVAASSAVTAFAADETGTATTFPLVQGVVDNISAILPVGLGLFAIFLGIRIIPGLLSRFARM